MKETMEDLWRRIAMERETTINTLNDDHLYKMEKWKEKVAFMRQLAEENHANWQELNDREIVMGEKIKHLKEYADSIEMSEMCFEIRQLMSKIYDL